jgi:hypothetical protein
VPHIIVTADQTEGHGETAVMLCERVSQTDLESQHFAGQLLERLGWAVEDAHERERMGDARRLGRTSDEPRQARTEVQQRREPTGDDEQRHAHADDARVDRVEVRSLGRRRVTLPTS